MNSQPIILETERLILRPHTLHDFADMMSLWTEPEVCRFTSVKTPASPEDCWARLLRYAGTWSLLGFGYFALLEKRTSVYLAEAGLADSRRHITPSLDGFAEAGWALLPSEWKKGIAQEAMMAIFDWYAQTPKSRPLACIINPENAVSIRLAEKLGFKLKAQTEYHATPCLMFER